MSMRKKRSRFVSAAMRSNAVANAKRHDWASERQERAVAAAGEWVGRTDDALWGMVTAQELPRTVYTNEGVTYKGQQPYCPGCGEAAPAKSGREWWEFDDARPWKIWCEHCGEVYPKNDFGAFYRTALDEHGMFRRELGDRSLLFNADHPDPDDPLHERYVDDGYGMFDEQGNRHDIIAYYNFEAVWRRIQQGVAALSDAYALTNDRRYAHKASVLLDRIADVYPEMDYLPLHEMGFQHSQGGSGRGRIEGCIWETFVAQGLARSYDVIFDGLQGDEELVAFCSDRAGKYDLGDKESIAAICGHIHDHLLLEVLASVKDGRISGNTGMNHTSLATAAIALDHPELTPEWLDWLFHPGFPGDHSAQHDPVSWVLTEGLDRDGMGGECGGYGLIWTRHMRELAQILSAWPEYTKHNLVEDYPKLKQAYLVESRLNVLDGMMPNTGDSGAVGAWGRQGDAATYVRAYRLYGDPRFAALAWHEHSAHGSTLRLDDDIFREDPDALIREIRNVGRKGPDNLTSEHFGRYGQAQLQTERPENGRAVFIHYGQGKGHSHHDALNLGLLANNVAMMPDLGYPEYTGTWPKRHAWTANTISHNTLLVGDTRSAYSPGGQVEYFAVEPPLRAIQVDAPDAYEDLQTYRRTVALVDVDEDNSYVLDVFRARGGSNHRLSWHGAAETADVAGLELVVQKGGAFAGSDVSFATLDGENADFFKESGFTYLYDVERSPGAVRKPYRVDWKIEDIHGRISEGCEPHLRLHALTPCDEVALATGDSPRRLQRPRYLIQSRLGEEMQSIYLNVLEPYDTNRFISRVRELEVRHDGDACCAAAVAVELFDGHTDVLISCEEAMEVEVDGGIRFDGTLGLIRLARDEVKLMRMIGGTSLAVGGVELTAERPAWRGRVTGTDASDPANNLVDLDPPLPAGPDLVGRTIHFINDLPMDTSYRIAAVTNGGVSTGDITIVRGLREGTDLAGGYTYLVNPGDEYIVPSIAGLGEMT